MIRRLLFVLGLVISSQVYAGSDTHPDEGEAFAHCSSDAASVASYAQGVWPSHQYGAEPCVYAATTPNNKYSCVIHFTPLGGSQKTTPCESVSGKPAGVKNDHYFPPDEMCADQDMIGPLDPTKWGSNDAGEKNCLLGCTYEVVMGCPQGIGFCAMYSMPTGSQCSGLEDVGPEEPQPPAGCTLVDGQLECDCVANPESWFCGSYEEEPVPNACTGSRCVDDDDGKGGGTDPGGGGGDGDGDGDGDGGGGIPPGDDGDCNPLSNAECDYTGSGAGSTDCETAPTCDGDPVQCAILTQEWNHQCYPYKEVADPSHVFEDEDFGEDGWLLDEISSESIDVADSFDGLDTDGYLGAGTCPAFPSISTSVGVFAIDGTPFCTALGWIGYFIMVSAGLVSIRIMTSARVFS